MSEGKSNRDILRAQIFAAENCKPKSVEVEFFGTTIELRQPNLDTILGFQAGTDRKTQLVDVLLSYAYVPGTNEKVFEEGDRDTLLSMPFNADFRSLIDQVNKLTDLNEEAASAEKNSEDSLSD